MVVRNKIQMDPELKSYIDTIIDEMTYSEVYQKCVGRFGENRAPSRTAIARYWLAKSSGHVIRPPRSIIERDPELRSYIELEKDGRIFKCLHAMCCEQFGVDRAPSVSAIARYWMRTHGRIRSKRKYKRCH